MVTLHHRSTAPLPDASTSVRVSGQETARRAAPGRLLVHRRLGLTGRAHGQGLAEFALVLPLLLITVLGALDVGRAFYTWVTLTNGARVGAAYAALYPTASFGPGSDYDQLVRAEGLGSLGAICPLVGGAVPQPTFTDGDNDGNTRSLGDGATVGVTCTFKIITPVVAQILGGQVGVGASATFPIRVGP